MFQQLLNTCHFSAVCRNDVNGSAAPCGKFKIKIYESSNHTYSGYTNIHIADELGSFCCVVGHGKTQEEALEDTVSEFFKMTKRKNTWEEQDFQYADSYDF